jgi:hypothetical protein
MRVEKHMYGIVLADHRPKYRTRYGWSLREATGVVAAGYDEMASGCSRDHLKHSEARGRKRSDAKLAASTWVHGVALLCQRISPRKVDARHLFQLVEEGHDFWTVWSWAIQPDIAVTASKY